MTYQYTDVAIVGCGMVGGALALGLAQQEMAVTVIEQQAEPLAFDPTQKPDVRISSISAASVDLLRCLGIWEAILAMRAHPYCRLETWVWDSAHVTFDAIELKLPLLGYMVENNVLQLALWQALKTRPEVTLRVLASLKALYRENNRHLLTLDNGETLVAKLVVGADGANSQVRQMAGIGIHAWQYQQSCMLITVECEKEPGDSVWQHFTPSGPHAFLPLFEHWASLVWYDTPARICQLQEMSMVQLQREIDNHFPARLSKVRPVTSGAFPLTRRHALKYVRDGLALIGDAAHTIHPLAGQGVNLGYRDVAALLEVLANASSHGEDWVSEKVLKRYQTRRMVDNLMMQFWVDLFYACFSNDLGPVRLLRNIGLIATERAGVLKRLVLRYALGL